MAKIASFTQLSGITLQRNRSTPLYQQLYQQMKLLILNGQLRTGAQLPSTRNLCEELDLSRSTVVEAINQLTAEGYVFGQVGRGTFVCDTLPESMLNPPEEVEEGGRWHGAAEVTSTVQGQPSLSRRGLRIGDHLIKDTKGPLLLQPGIPDTSEFRFGIWRKLLNRHWQAENHNGIAYGYPAGYPPLRAAIADHVRVSRRVNCTPEQVIITAGSQQALFLAGQLLIDPGDAAWVENPGYSAARAAFLAAGADLVPIPVDSDGMQVEVGIQSARPGRIVYVCPSHQYPVGGTLSLTRRMQLLNWAASADAWIIEDDYDSEFRYIGHPLAALQSLDQENRVIYIGTFSKVLFPGLRVGYMVVPKSLVDHFATAKSMLDRSSPQTTQMVLADFLREGHLNRHIRKMRVRYGARQAVVVDAIQSNWSHLLEVHPSPAGIHLLVWLPPDKDDRSISKLLREEGIGAQPLSSYSIIPLSRGGLVLGYAAHDEGTLRAAVKRLGEIIEREAECNH